MGFSLCIRFFVGFGSFGVCKVQFFGCGVGLIGLRF